MKALEYLTKLPKELRPFDKSLNRKASNSSLRRWLNNNSIIINGNKPKALDDIEFPITQLVYFPNGNTITIY